MPDITYNCTTTQELVSTSDTPFIDVCQTVSVFEPFSKDTGEPCVFGLILSKITKIQVVCDECLVVFQYIGLGGVQESIALGCIREIDHEFETKTESRCACDFPEGIDYISNVKLEKQIKVLSPQLKTKEIEKSGQLFDFLRSPVKRVRLQEFDNEGKVCKEWWATVAVATGTYTLVTPQSSEINYQIELAFTILEKEASFKNINKFKVI